MPPSLPPFLPYGRQSIGEDDIAAVVAVLRGDWLTQGPAVDAFEQALAGRVGAAHAVACANGTAALYMAARALGLAAGDAVVVPAITFLATANAVRLAGAEVAFADVDPHTGLMTPAHAEAALDRARRRGWRPRALFPVHFAGQTVDMAALGQLARDRGLAVVEDGCHAIGAESAGSDGHFHPVGACRESHMTVFSFHPVKTIAAGEGGAVTTGDAALARRLRQLRNHAMERDPAAFTDPALACDADGTPNPWYYEAAEPGFNFRLTDLQCALALSQLGRLDGFIARRRALVERYDRALAPLAPVLRPLGRAGWCRPAWHLYVVLVDFAALGYGRARLMAALRDAGIGSQLHYIPVAWQPCYKERYGPAELPGAAAYYRCALSLPLYAALADADVDRVADTLHGLVGQR